MNALFNAMAVPYSDEEIGHFVLVFQNFLHGEIEEDGLDVSMGADGPLINRQAYYRIGMVIRKLAADLDRVQKQSVSHHADQESVLKGALNNTKVRYVSAAVLVGAISYLVYRGIKN